VVKSPPATEGTGVIGREIESRLGVDLYKITRKKSRFGKISDGLAMEDVGILLRYLSIWSTAVWPILWPFGIFFPILVCFAKKNLATPPKLSSSSEMK
jgi:hypothetical protein